MDVYGEHLPRPLGKGYRDLWGRPLSDQPYGSDEVVKGLQGTNDGKYDKLHACAKHFLPYTPVRSGTAMSLMRKISSPVICMKTYLPPFGSLVKEGKVKEVMCAYNRFEGDPCCGSDRLLMQILRDEWGFDGIVRTVELLLIFTEIMVIRRILMRSPLRRLRC